MSESQRPKDWSHILGSLPLFPLPDAVLFPGAVLPLHIFEPRYRAMIRDVIRSHNMLAVVRIKSDKAIDSHGHPEIHEIAGMGEIIEHTELSDGRFNIVVQGRARVSLSELPFLAPYRRAEAKVIDDIPETVTSDELTSLTVTANTWIQCLREKDPSFGLRVATELPPGVIVNIFAHHLIVDSMERQRILELTSTRSRIQNVCEILALQRMAHRAEKSSLN